MEELKKELNDSIKMLQQRKQEVEKWCSEQKDREETPVSEMIVPLDMYSKQMVNLVANKIAIEDALYSLDRAFENNKIDMIDFMKEVRKLAKDEFMIVALKNKVIQSNPSLSPKTSSNSVSESQFSQSQPFTNGFPSGAPGSTLTYNVPPPSYNTSNMKYP